LKPRFEYVSWKLGKEEAAAMAAVAGSGVLQEDED